MLDVRTGKDIKEISILDEPKNYIYIMLNDAGKIKIGKTKNIQQRYSSLCGSNGQGNKIIKLCCSPSTYLNTLESIMHANFKKYRIAGTEWFYDNTDPSGEKLFDNAVNKLQLLFSSDSYKKCNKLRKDAYKRNKKVCDCNE